MVADLLDKFRIRWEYEPTLFELTHDEDGRCTMGFRPDFYLPDHDLYIEVTWARQEHTTNKRTRARLVSEKYPGTRIEILYRRDFDDLEERVLSFIYGV